MTLVLGVVLGEDEVMRYLLQQDDDGHWYVIPADKRDEFDTWLSDGYVTQPQPTWAWQVGGHPNNVTFTEPEIFGERVS